MVFLYKKLKHKFFIKIIVKRNNNLKNRFQKMGINDFKEFIKKLELQALETAEERIPLYMKIGLKDAESILDVGCGPGTVTLDIAHLTKGKVVGVDSSKKMVDVASEILKDFENVKIFVASAENLPFEDNSFEITTCNLVLMWSKNPQKVVDEMARVTKKGGCVLASLEPDYGGKLHFPENPKVDPIFAGEAIKARGGDLISVENFVYFL